MNDHVGKPIEPEELWAALICWIPPRESASLVQAMEDPTPPLAVAAAAPLRIEGLDTAAGLRRVLGKPAQYLSLLSKFVETQPGTFEELPVGEADQGE